MKNWLGKMFKMVTSWTANKVGFGIAVTGIAIKELAVVLLMLGVLLWMFRRTKVFRVGAVSYLVGLIIEILGSLIMM